MSTQTNTPDDPFKFRCLNNGYFESWLDLPAGWSDEDTLAQTASVEVHFEREGTECPFGTLQVAGETFAFTLQYLTADSLEKLAEFLKRNAAKLREATR